MIDPKNFDPRSFVDIKADVCIVPPNSFALARTVEYFRIPRDVLTMCLGKSTYARCGIIVNVTPFEPEWEGTVTLEISNTTPLPAKIYANEGIAQVLFFQSDEPCEISYADKKGKYPQAARRNAAAGSEVDFRRGDAGRSCLVNRVAHRRRSQRVAQGRRHPARARVTRVSRSNGSAASSGLPLRPRPYTTRSSWPTCPIMFRSRLRALRSRRGRRAVPDDAAADAGGDGQGGLAEHRVPRAG